MNTFGHRLATGLRDLDAEGLARVLRRVDGAQGPRVVLDGREVVLLSSNNYLGLADHPRIREAAARAARDFGAGAGASRLISGHMTLHEAFEERIRRFKGSQAALLFSTGYMANVAVLSTLAGPGDLILSDALNHASLIDGCRLSRAEVRVFTHRDPADLRTKLADRERFGTVLIATDGVFSMDGDVAPLPAYVDIAGEYDAALIVDDAHGVGALGPGGRGTVAHFGLEGEVEVVVGTLGKALGVFGAYVTGSALLRRYLVNRARSFIFTTAPPPAVAAAAIAALDVLETEGPTLLARLWENVRHWREGLRGLGVETLDSETQILPILTGDNRTTMEISEHLLKRGVYAQGIRPPTVPAGLGRLRTTVMATHTRADLDLALEALAEVRVPLVEARDRYRSGVR